MEFPQVNFQGMELQPSFSNSNESFSPRGDFLLSRDTASLEEHQIFTSCGIYQRVYVQRSSSKAALFTYHDIGTNHTSFLGFFNHPEMRVLTQHFTVYHICAPGHHENAPAVAVGDAQTGPDQTLLSHQEPRSSAPQLVSSTGSLLDSVRRHSSFFTTGSQYPDLNQLADMLTSILMYFGIDYFVGFGMGAGSNILARYALRHSDHVLGLFLLNPNCTTHSYYQWFRNRWSDLPSLEKGVITDSLMDQLESHWFGFGLVENGDIPNFYEELARSLNPVNLAGYIRAYVDRTPINLVRPTGPPMPGSEPSPDAEPTVIQTDVCLVTGDKAVELSRAVADMNGQMDPKRTQFLSIPDCSGMVMEENPSKLALNFLHFLRSIGLVINLTPEKLRQQARTLQQAVVDVLPEEKTPAKVLVGAEI